ncbi:MAG: hypothetical protein ACRELB_17360 [Polyangiaceae bacterium]
MKKIIAVAVAAAVLGVTSLAAAQEKAGEKEFGNPGVIAIGGDTTANLGFTQHSPPNGGTSTNDLNFSIAPNIQYFVAEGISVGGTLLFDWTKPNQGDATTTFGIGPTVGYNLWLSPGSLSLWPQATFLFETASGPTGLTAPAPTSGSTTLMNVGVFVPLLIHPVSHFHFGVGPYFNIDLSNKESAGGQSADLPKDMHVGIAFEVAGWL